MSSRFHVRSPVMISTLSPTYYEILGVHLRASDDEIRSAYERAVARLEADGPGAAAAMQAQLLEAMEILTDPDLRQEYNRITHLTEPPPPPLPSGAEVVASEPVPGPVRFSEPMPSEQLTLEALLEGTDLTLPPRPQARVSYVPRTTRPEMEAISLERAQELVASAAALGNTAAAMPSPSPSPSSSPAPAAATTTDATTNARPTTSASAPTAATSASSAPPAPVPAPSPNAATPEASRFPIDKSRLSTAEFESAQRVVEEQAIATAEAAMARVAARVREVRTDQRPKSLEIPADAAFTGELLRQVREARGLSLQQLADRTRVSIRHLENIEADRYKALPATVYLRGILMNLARELSLDPLRVARTYLELAGMPQKGGN